jgi:hypothetical protein
LSLIENEPVSIFGIRLGCRLITQASLPIFLALGYFFH